MSDKGNVRSSFLWSDGPSVGGESDGKGHCGRFLLLFRTAHVAIHIFSVYYIIRVEDSNALQKNLGTDLTKFYELVNFNST